MNSCIACHYPVSTNAFSHRIMPYLLQRRFGVPVARAAGAVPAVFGTGSNLSLAGRGAIVCGAGFRDEDAPVSESLASAKLLGVRGRLSARRIARETGAAADAIPLGNAWSLLPEILPQTVETEFEFGVLPHPRDLNHPFFTAGDASGGRLISPFDDLESAVAQIRQCRLLLTTSLDGLMIADAFGIPSRWIRIERAREISDFPFRDYLSGCDGTTETPATIRHHWDFAKLAAEARVRSPRKDLPGLSLSSLDACRDHWPLRECRVSFSSSEQRRRHPIPIFVISFNRLKCLKRLVASLEESSLPVEVVIHDNGSDYPPLLDYLEALESRGTVVARNPKLKDNPEGLEQINDTIARYFEGFSEPLTYAVTDPDICFKDADPGFLELYRDLLDRFPGVDCVGPQLAIHDIPGEFPTRDWVVHRHRHFWNRPPDQYLRWRDRDVYLRTNSVIDTTFGLFRAGSRFKRLGKAIRVYSPFDARHLDWYEGEPDDEMKHYQATASEISHWQGQYAREQSYRNFRLGPTTIFITEPDNDEEAASGAWRIKRLEI